MPGKKADHLASSGHLPSAGTLSVPSESISKHFFRSTSKHVQSHPELSTKLGRPARDGAKYKEARGREANLKMMDWKHSVAYRPSHEDTNHRRTFTEMPLDNAALDRELCNVFLLRGRSGGGAATGQKMSSQTANRAFFPQRTGPQPPKVESLKPERDEFIERDLLETTSTSTRHYPWHQTEMAQRFRGKLVDPPKNSSPLPAPSCVAGRAASTLQLSHSAAELAGGAAPATWQAFKRKGKGPPLGEAW